MRTTVTDTETLTAAAAAAPQLLDAAACTRSTSSVPVHSSKLQPSDFTKALAQCKIDLCSAMENRSRVLVFGSIAVYTCC